MSVIFHILFVQIDFLSSFFVYRVCLPTTTKERCASTMQWHLLCCLSVSCFVIIRKRWICEYPSIFFYIWLIESSHFLGLIFRYYHMIYSIIVSLEIKRKTRSEKISQEKIICFADWDVFNVDLFSNIMRLSRTVYQLSNHIDYYSKFQPTSFSLQSLIDFGR